MKLSEISLYEAELNIEQEYYALLNSEFNSKGTLRGILNILFKSFKIHPERNVPCSKLLKNTKVDRDKYTETAQRYVVRRINPILDVYNSKFDVTFRIEKEGDNYRFNIKYKKHNFLNIRSVAISSFASPPVWEAAAFAPSSVRPAFMARTGFFAATSLATSINVSGSLKPST